MTTLAEILTPEGLLPEGFPATSRGLVFGSEVYDLIMSIQTPEMPHRISPVATTDGRYLSCADILSEATRGLYKPIFDQIPPETALSVEVVPWEEALALLPVPDPEDLP
ncbi:hypothetical protein SCBWM1_gp89 [Synechococcus phage S-CBWM1]|uniref:Uncharacterized protein n=1 Tax=Synechococcus phage S-CBWM1 TaxID=2053653 RepID=A0A3G1L3L4_9CAUD|nr:hypothetical protein HOU61_gp108 [Synechococcus phage S-CBWM1]ATW62773.1 hypothetical protein SCBWM1_gp89 [Synechococcus phage S-CBWM1]